MKRNHPLIFSLWLIDPGGTLSQVDLLYFHIGARRDTFILSYVYKAVQRANKHEYKAYWYMNLSLINGCGTRKNNICGHFFLFEVALGSSTNIIKK